jgi:uncharacterized repeat protein (TIGR03803 family)
MKRPILILAAIAGIIVPGPLAAQTDAVLYSFTNGSDGADPVAGLLLANGRLYGTSSKGGPATDGTVFSVNPDGTGYRVLHGFAGPPDGAHPLGKLALAGNLLYGTTSGGGSNSFGTVFALNTNGDAYGYAVLYHFNPSSNGVMPSAGLTLAGGTLYGTASGAGYGNPGWGTVFAINTNGVPYTALYNFSVPSGTPLANADGEQPLSDLVLSGGKLYGTAYGGGAIGYGTVFSLGTDGSNFSVLHAFSNAPDGAFPQSGLTLGGTTLFGTTQIGGTNGNGTLFAVNTDGSGYSVLHHFLTNGVDGLRPHAVLTLSGRTLYGTTRGGGGTLHGTVFSISTNGLGYTVLSDFTNTPDGANPESELLYSGSTLYGTTEAGGSSIWGTVFGLTIPPLKITGLTPAGTNLMLNVVNAVAGETYTLLTSSNVTLPLSQWTPAASNLPATNPSFTFTVTNAVTPGQPQQFYLLEAQ